MTQSLLECNEEEDQDAYNEEIINICSQPHPNPFFQSAMFIDVFEYQCQQMSWCFLVFSVDRDHLVVGAETAAAEVPHLRVW